ncbi:hypothetical protein ASPACDRAFT_126323 [Aspergillus aculeatus ATCC 16872]|uniref:Hydrophobin n=1 Tax=Aspergillus aculeatus (strain ATCC 16872 / CBS 172.66 / WB 5094) TaxID=690307 RepID=A0A1L9WIM6_ASPA1|nr:uncharacterized protein ASPACDRAFT_126323 [Aspergillus aculeatus ATCC 16872]OJJ96054.1 hypothetical protein ASPACDRAFT_126323 [Aspergillus aculeatus ATCC 16872]
MRVTAILPFLALAFHPLTAFAQEGVLGELAAQVATTLGYGKEPSCDPDDLYCCIYRGPGTDYYTRVQEYTDPGAGVGSNCDLPDEETRQCNSNVRTLVCCTDSYGVWDSSPSQCSEEPPC